LPRAAVGAVVRARAGDDAHARIVAGVLGRERVIHTRMLHSPPC
jgi:hypothetical protein